MIAMLAYGISASAEEAPGTVLDSRREAGAAGTATTTASAVTYSGSAAEPTVSRQPPVVRVSSRTIAPVLMSAFDALASASGSAPRPVPSVTNNGAAGVGLDEAGAGGGSSAAAASVSAWCFLAAAASGPRVAWKDSSSLRPAYTPPSSGSTSLSTISAPSRAPMYPVTETSSSPAAASGVSRRARATPSVETSLVAASSLMSAGTPMNWRRGSERIFPRL